MLHFLPDACLFRQEYDLTMKIPMYLYSVNRNEVAPSEMASCKSAAFWTICTGTGNQACVPLCANIMLI